MTFHVGQKVVCVSVDPFIVPCTQPDEYDTNLNGLALGATYTVRWCKPTRRKHFGKFTGVRVDEIKRPYGDPSFFAGRFRPVVEHKTDAGFAILEEIRKRETEPAPSKKVAVASTKVNK